MQVRPQAQIPSGLNAKSIRGRCAQLCRALYLEALQQLRGIQRREQGALRRAEFKGDGFIFGGQQAAGGIHQAAARLEQVRSLTQDGFLSFRERLDRKSVV